jgi:hypothetical protein
MWAAAMLILRRAATFLDLCQCARDADRPSVPLLLQSENLPLAHCPSGFLPPQASSEAFTRLAYRPESLTARWKRGIIPPLRE